jgi:hypothetical protein
MSVQPAGGRRGLQQEGAFKVWLASLMTTSPAQQSAQSYRRSADSDSEPEVPSHWQPACRQQPYRLVTVPVSNLKTRRSRPRTGAPSLAAAGSEGQWARGRAGDPDVTTVTVSDSAVPSPEEAPAGPCAP